MYGMLKPIIKNEAHWIAKKRDSSHYDYICDHCESKSRFRKTPYCPICGYRMIEEERF